MTLYDIILCYIILHYIILYYIMLYYAILCHKYYIKLYLAYFSYIRCYTIVEIDNLNWQISPY